MTTLKQVAKEDLEEGEMYLYRAVLLEIFGCVTKGCFMSGEDMYSLQSLRGEFYGPIELEVE